MTRPKILYTLCFCLLLALPVLATTYIFTDINPFNSLETSARGINDANDVVGDYATAADLAVPGGIEHGFLLHNGTFSKINFPNSLDTDANGINNLGTIVGGYAAKLADGTRGEEHGYIKDKKGYHTLPDPPGGSNSFPDFNAINDEGDIVGVVSTINGNRGFVFDDGVYTLLDCGTGFNLTEANGINANEDIVGECLDSSFFSHAFLLHNGVYHIFEAPGALLNDGTVACDGTVAWGINALGDIAGTYDDANCVEHGFVVEHLLGTPIWKTVDHLGATDTKVSGINKNGHLVGTATNSQDKGFRAQ